MNTSATDPAQAIAPLTVSKLTVSVPGRTLVRDLSLTLQRGDWLALLGGNGTGKTRTLETLCHLQRPDSGNIAVHGDNIAELGHRARARAITLVSQHQDDAFNNRVVDNVALGHYAQPGAWPANVSDDKVAMACLAQGGAAHVAQQTTQTLSGGERQRVAIAQALVQNTDVLLLDEPLSHQDPAQARALLQVFKQLCASGRTLISSLHDVNTALHCASHALLLDGEGGWQLGRVASLLDEQRVSALYGMPMSAVQTPRGIWFVPQE